MDRRLYYLKGAYCTSYRIGIRDVEFALGLLPVCAGQPNELGVAGVTVGRPFLQVWRVSEETFPSNTGHLFR